MIFTSVPSQGNLCPLHTTKDGCATTSPEACMAGTVHFNQLLNSKGSDHREPCNVCSGCTACCVFYDIAEQQTVKYRKLCALGALHCAIHACSGNKSCQPEKSSETEFSTLGILLRNKKLSVSTSDLETNILVAANKK